jgi:hypothetical protein
MLRRSLIAVAAVVLLAAACTTTEESDATTSTAAATTEPTAPPTTVPAATAPASGDDRAAEAFIAIPGYTFAPADETVLRDALESIAPILPAFVGSATTSLRNDDGVIATVLSLVPVVDHRGDPMLVSQLVESLAGAYGTEATEQDVAGLRMRVFESIEGTWFTWSNHTRILVAVAADPVQGAPAFGRLALANSVEYAWVRGDCLNFAPDRTSLPYAPFGSSETVSCDAIHTHEVIYTATVGEGPEEPIPADLGLRVKHECEDAFAETTGVPYWQSTLLMTLYLPDATEWEAGDRYLACVVSREGPDGTPLDLTGVTVTAAEDWSFDVIATPCWGSSFKPVSARGCDLPHVHEAVGMLTHPAPAGLPFPNPDDLDSFRTDACTALIAESVSPAPSGFAVVPVPHSIGRAEWDEGERAILCAARVHDAFTGNAVQISGPLTGDWTIIGPDEGTITAQAPTGSSPKTSNREALSAS